MRRAIRLFGAAVLAVSAWMPLAHADDGYRLVHSFVDTLGVDPGAGGFEPVAPGVAHVAGGEWGIYGTLSGGGHRTPNTCGPQGCLPIYPDCGNQGCGVIYALTPPPAGGTHWAQRRIYVLKDKEDGYNPSGTLAFDGQGNAYTTNQDNANGVNTLYRLAPPTGGHYFWTKTVLHTFRLADGPYPSVDVVVDAAARVYGTAQGEPFTEQANGNVWMASPPAAGQTAWGFKILHRFSDAEGSYATSPLTLAPGGRLYGSTLRQVFELTPPASGQSAWTYRVIASPGANCGYVGGALVRDAAGNLYGAAIPPGQTTGDPACTNTYGTIFRLEPPSAGSTTWTRRVLYRFTGSSDGSFPQAPLLLGPGGVLFGTTFYGVKKVDGTAEQTGGTIYKLPPPASGSAWKLTVLHTFPTLQYPLGGLTFDPAGNLIGTTEAGGDERLGSVFQVRLSP